MIVQSQPHSLSHSLGLETFLHMHAYLCADRKACYALRHPLLQLKGKGLLLKVLVTVTRRRLGGAIVQPQVWVPEH